MTVTIRMPTPLRPYVNNQEIITLETHGTVQAIFQDLTDTHSGLKKYIYDNSGKFRSYINIYLNDHDIRYLNGMDTSVKAGDTLSIIPSIAGGSLSKEELQRYNRHIILPEVGLAGQEKLKSGSALLVGAGGLGSPMALYLAAAGVGRIGLIDFDVVDASNLQRQILYGTSMIGSSKLKNAKERLLDLNPHIIIETYEERLSSANALDIFRKYDVIADGTDNFATRYLVNDACVLTKKPNVYGSIFRFEGQISVFNYQDGPCYRCLYAEPPPAGFVPSCAEGGVLGVLPGVIGTLQANEVIKILLGIGDVASKRLILYDALRLSFQELKLQKNPVCVLCGEHASQKTLIDYEQFCGLSSTSTHLETVMENEITVNELKTLLDKKADITLIDVREPHEYQISKIEGSILIPLGTLDKKVSELPPEKNYVIHCKMGGRSAQAVAFLQKNGFKNVKNLVGGINKWAKEIDTNIPTY